MAEHAANAPPARANRNTAPHFFNVRYGKERDSDVYSCIMAGTFRKIARKLTSRLFMTGYQASFLVLLALFSVVATISAIGTYRISMQGAKNLLETRAIDVAVNIGFTLERLGLRSDMFEELLSSDQWEHLAFLTLFDKDGTILIHSNQVLSGRRIYDENVQEVLRTMRPVINFQKLATGEEVFVLYFPLSLHIAPETSDGVPDPVALSGPGDEGMAPGLDALKPSPVARTFCLKVALHPYKAYAITRKANIQLGLIISSIVILWILALFFIRSWRRNYRLEEQLREQERLAVLGQMAAVLAHEIRNPLSSIKGFAQIHMEDASECEDAEDLREDMELIVEETVRLERLTSALLEYARSPDLRDTVFNLEEFCRDLVRHAISSGDADLLDVRCDSGEVHMDREKLLQIIINLLQNATDAVREQEDGRVSLSIRLQDSMVVLKVSDNGPGIPEQVRKKLFEPFMTTKTRGTGLGLSIVKRLCDAMGGKIEIDSDPDRGTDVTITFPQTGSAQNQE